MADVPAHRVLRTDLEQAIREWSASGSALCTITILRNDFPLLAEAAAEAVPDPWGCHITVAHDPACPCQRQRHLPITACRCTTLRCTLTVVDARTFRG